MLSVNEVTLVGWLGSDPEVGTTRRGNQFVRFRICTRRFYRGEEYTDWHTVVAWSDRIAKFASNHLRSGSHIYVRGRLNERAWEGDDGQTRRSTEVVAWAVEVVGKLGGGGPKEYEPEDQDVPEELRKLGFEKDERWPTVGPDEDLPF